MIDPKFINPGECQSISLTTLDEIHESIPVKFYKAATKLEFTDFAVDSKTDREDDQILALSQIYEIPNE